MIRIPSPVPRINYEWNGVARLAFRHILIEDFTIVAPSPLLGLTDVDKLNKSAIVLKRHSHASLFHRIPSFFPPPPQLIRTSDGCFRFIKSLLSKREGFFFYFTAWFWIWRYDLGFDFFFFLSLFSFCLFFSIGGELSGRFDKREWNDREWLNNMILKNWRKTDSIIIISER